jgi:hypothetical protein
MFAIAIFGALLLLYLLPVLVGYRANIGGRAQLFIIVCLLVSAIAMFPPALVLLSTPATVFTLAAAGASIIFPSLLWFAAFAAACLTPGKRSTVGHAFTDALRDAGLTGPRGEPPHKNTAGFRHA